MKWRLFKNSILGALISVFILNVLLILLSKDHGTLTLTLDSSLKGSDVSKYIYQFLAACWTGAVIPIAINLLKEEGKTFHFRVALNMLLIFSIYLVWFTFLYGFPESIFSLVILFIVFGVTEYWIVYGIQFIALKRNVDQVNRRIDSIENGFLRRGDHIDAYKKYPQ